MSAALCVLPNQSKTYLPTYQAPGLLLVKGFISYPSSLALWNASNGFHGTISTANTKIVFYSLKVKPDHSESVKMSLFLWGSWPVSAAETHQEETRFIPLVVHWFYITDMMWFWPQKKGSWLLQPLRNTSIHFLWQSCIFARPGNIGMKVKTSSYVPSMYHKCPLKHGGEPDTLCRTWNPLFFTLFYHKPYWK